MGSSELIYSILDSDGGIPLPDLDKKLEMSRTDIVSTINSRDSLELSFVFDEEKNLAYHIVQVNR